MEHIHLLVSTFDTVTLRSRPPSETKTETKTREAKTKTKTKTSRVETKTKTKTSKKVVLIGLETKTRSRDPHPWVLHGVRLTVAIYSGSAALWRLQGGPGGPRPRQIYAPLPSPISAVSPREANTTIREIIEVESFQ